MGMPLSVRVFLVAFSVAFLALILELIRQKKLREELSLIWLLVGFAGLGMAFTDILFDWIALRIGVHYGPALALLLGFLLLVLTLLYFSTVISDLKTQNKELAQRLALLEAEQSNRRENRPQS